MKSMRNKQLMPTLCESVVKLKSTKQAATPKNITEYIWTTTSDASLRPDLATVRKALKLAVKQGILQRSRDGTYRINLKADPDDTPARRNRNRALRKNATTVLRHSRSRSRGRRKYRRSSRHHRRSSRRHRRRSHSRRRHSRSYSYEKATLSPYSGHRCKPHLYGTYYYDY